MANLYDRVQESTTTTGTGTYALGGAVTGFRTFNSQAANGTVIRCVIEDGVGGYEVGDYTLGTNTLARTTIIESSNSNNAVNWGSGTKYIYSDATVKDVLPDQTSNSGKFLITDGTNPAWSNTVSSLTLSGGTANGVLYLNGSKAATSGSALTFDGNNLGLGVTLSAWSSPANLEFSSAGGYISGRAGLAIGGAFYAGAGGYKYSAAGSLSATVFQPNPDGTFQWRNDGAVATRAIGDAISLVTRMALDANGTFRVKGAGTAGSTDAFQVSGSAPASAVSVDSSGNLLVGSTDNNPANNGTSGLAYRSGSAGYLSITSSGNYAAWLNRQGTDGSVLMFGKATYQVGSVSVTATTTAYNTTSDYRLKNITSALTGYKERILALQPKQGTWIADGSEFRGFLAHEFAEQYPSLVSGEKDAVDENGNPKYQGLQAGGSETIADLVALVKDLVAEVETLKSQLGK